MLQRNIAHSMTETDASDVPHTKIESSCNTIPVLVYYMLVVLFLFCKLLCVIYCEQIF